MGKQEKRKQTTEETARLREADPQFLRSILSFLLSIITKYTHTQNRTTTMRRRGENENGRTSTDIRWLVFLFFLLKIFLSLSPNSCYELKS